MKRLPVYLVLDVSGSMSGEPIEAVKTGVQLLHTSLRKDPYALEAAYIGVITFGNSVEQKVPLTELSQFQPPDLIAGGGTPFYGALQKVTECANNEIRKKTVNAQDYDTKPLVFIMTDGSPTDRDTGQLQAFKNYRWGVVVACAAGSAADVSALQQVTENVVKLDTADQSTIAAYFKWVSSSISTGSKKIDETDNDITNNELPPPPPEINLVKP